MKTAEEYAINESGQAHEYGYNLDVIPMVDAIRIMKEYAKQVAAQALKDASENAMIEVNNNLVDVYHVHTENVNATIQASEISILRTEIKTP